MLNGDHGDLEMQCVVLPTLAQLRPLGEQRTRALACGWSLMWV